MPSAAEAETCNDPCAESDRYTLIDVGNHENIPPDGFVSIATRRGSAGRLSDEETLEFFQVEVTHTVEPMVGPIPIAGGLEVVEGVVVWRPDAPLDVDVDVGSFLSVDASVLNSSIDDRIDCAPDRIATRGQAVYRVIDSSTPELSVNPGFETDVRPIDSAQLADWVCCGETTLQRPDGCPSPVFDAGIGRCIASVGQRAAHVVAAPFFFGDPDRLMPTSTKLELLVDGTVVGSALGWQGRVDFTAPFAFQAELRVTSLIDGTTQTSDVFEVHEDLDGAVPVDVQPILDSICDGDEPYHCVVVDTPDGQAWDPELCSPWPEPLPMVPLGTTGGTGEQSGGGDGTTGEQTGQSTGAAEGTSTPLDGDGGCSCRASGPGVFGPLSAFFGLVACFRRRTDIVPTPSCPDRFEFGPQCTPMATPLSDRARRAQPWRRAVGAYPAYAPYGYVPSWHSSKVHSSTSSLSSQSEIAGGNLSTLPVRWIDSSIRSTSATSSSTTGSARLPSGARYCIVTWSMERKSVLSSQSWVAVEETASGTTVSTQSGRRHVAVPLETQGWDALRDVCRSSGRDGRQFV